MSTQNTQAIRNTEYIILMPMLARRFIWERAKIMFGEKLSLEGVAGLACRILESLFDGLRNSNRIGDSGEVLGRVGRTQRQNKEYVVVFIYVCLQLAAKMVCNSINVKKVQQLLMTHDMDYSIAEINEVERFVFNAIGFKVPLRTTVDSAASLAYDLGLSPRVVEVSGLLTYCMEMYLPQIGPVVYQAWANQPLPTSSSRSRETPALSQLTTDELVYGAVLASRMYLPHEPGDNAEQLLPKLASHGLIEAEFLQCVGDCLLSDIGQWNILQNEGGFEKQFTSIVAKRIRSDEESLSEEIPAKRRRDSETERSEN